MRGFLRRLRGIIGTALTWAVGFVAFFGLTRILVGDWSVLSASGIASLGIVGFIMGSVFSGILILIEGRRSLLDLSLRRVALWGAAGGLVVLGAFTLLSGTIAWDIWVGAVLATGGLSSGSVALAQRSEKKLLEGDQEPLPAIEGE
jgi:hypothetical protein